jgi:acylphosphatase
LLDKSGPIVKKPKDMDKENIQFTVTGKVQGVGFRSYVQSAALKLGVLGEVWNDQNGSVAGIAVAPSEAIRRFEELLALGPGANEVSIQPAYVNYPFGTFSIGRTR